MGYAHEVIVDDVCKVISRQTVALYEHLIVKSRVFNGDIAEDLVVERGAALPGYLLAHNERLAGRGLCVAFLAAEAAAGIGGLFKALGLLLLFAEAAVGVTLFDEKVGILAVKCAALGLNIGADRAADVGAFVVIKAALGHRAVDNVNRALDQTLLIGVLDAENELSAVVACYKPCVQRGAQIAHMHISRGAGRKSRANLALGYASFHLLEPCHIHRTFPPKNVDINSVKWILAVVK